ncbi:YfzA family protein [Alkalihalobacillus sp. LMS39]|uniref:YfzA family protein n=1 Tax=Alkalihalobacillus sp. LMS39 TaxID=2924032 RepID=UPI001FB4C68E|nr:YfzA family protein [Alkalihalobacillus sp. LMS39]UOE93700.1 YfzA family protein [Alkalihalobacillus sp. LMS39]
MRNWFINVGFFLVLILVLAIVDNTPFVTDFEFGSFGNEILQTKLFTEWFNFYNNAFFNVVLLFALMHIILFPFYSIKFKRTNK